MVPLVDDLTSTLIIGEDTGLMKMLNGIDLLLGRGDYFRLLSRQTQIIDTERKARASGSLETDLLHVIEECQGCLAAEYLEAFVDDLLEILLCEQVVVEGHPLPEQIVENDPSRSGEVQAMLIGLLHLARSFVNHHSLGHSNLDLCVTVNPSGAVSSENLWDAGEADLFAFHPFLRDRQVVASHDDILRRCDDRLAMGRREDVVDRQQQVLGLDLSLDG